MKDKASHTIKLYYEAFNSKSMDEFFDLMTEDVVHGINQGKEEIGKKPFREFMERMNKNYDEKAVDLVIFVNEKGDRAAAEFFIEGKYIMTDEGLPAAKGQRYSLRCGAFFSLREGKISRITNYYNLQEWLRQIK